MVCVMAFDKRLKMIIVGPVRPSWHNTGRPMHCTGAQPDGSNAGWNYETVIPQHPLAKRIMLQIYIHLSAAISFGKTLRERFHKR